MNPTVYISNKSEDHNYSPAAAYGSLRYITIGNYPIFKTTRLMEEIIKALVMSEPDDYLLISGSAIIAGMALATWMEMHAVVKVLLWDRANGTYVQRSLDRDTIRIMIQQASDQIEESEDLNGW